MKQTGIVIAALLCAPAARAAETTITMGKVVRVASHTEIDAAPQKVFEILQNAAGFGDWNPVFQKAKGAGKLEKVGDMVESQNGRLRQVVVEIVPNQTIVFADHVPGANFLGRTQYKVYNDKGKTRLLMEQQYADDRPDAEVQATLQQTRAMVDFVLAGLRGKAEGKLGAPTAAAPAPGKPAAAAPKPAAAPAAPATPAAAKPAEPAAAPK